MEQAGKQRGGRSTTGTALALLLLVLATPLSARALPRFAARTGSDCIQCHVNPGGGGVRSSYGRNIFERAWLPMFPRTAPKSPVPLEASDAQLAALESDSSATDDASDFSGDVSDWLAFGTDLRMAYLWIRPDRAVPPAKDLGITSSLFLMEAYLYLDAQLHKNVRMVLQLGPYQGFEAWALFRADPREDATFNLLVKAGHFFPTFGLREANHQLFTRQEVGFGNADRDTGVEVTGYAGPLTLSVSVMNGTLGGATFDTFGTKRRTFEKAVVARLSARARFSWLRVQAGPSFALNENVDLANPLFAAGLAKLDAKNVAQGLNELRFGGFVMASVGPFTYLADLVVVRNHFYAPELPTFMGYASYQELGWNVRQGLDLISTFEFMDSNVELTGWTSTRTGLVVEFFPWPFTEMRAMLRRTESDFAASFGSWDLSLQAHVFM
ncbi:MAG TPA: hypothetical protein VF331_01180 [Polyangiales bacterium]